MPGAAWRAHYPRLMSIETAESASLRAAIAAHRDALDTILERYQAGNPRVFGSMARRDATSESDIDLLVDLMPGGGNELLRVAPNLGVIGEAVRALPPATRDAMPDVPWASIAGLRTIVVTSTCG